MTKNSEAVKRWRKTTKERIVNAMGGKCQCCGYNKCNDALELHHIDPSMKEISFSKIRANPKSWSIIVNELRKSILLCSNCHKEIHAGVIELPKIYEKFDESYSDYKKSITEDRHCLHCQSKLTHNQNKFCSINCVRSSNINQKNRFDWSNLYDLKYNQKLSNLAIAEIIGCSGNSVAKQLKKMAPQGGIEPPTTTLTE